MVSSDSDAGPQADDSRVRRYRIGPRVISAAALVVLGACAAVVVGFPTPSVGLRSSPNWDLAKLLSGIHDFPADWNYSLRGSLRRTDPDADVAAPSGSAAGPASVYAPPECAVVPKIVELFGRPGFAALVRVDRQTDAIARPVLMSSDEPVPNAHFAIWPVRDGWAMIAKYVDWLGRCGSYRVTSTVAGSGNEQVRTVNTVIESRPGADREAALAVTRSTTVDAPVAGMPLVYHVSYHWVRGVLLECATNMVDGDVDVVNRVAAQTLQRIRAR